MTHINCFYHFSLIFPVCVLPVRMSGVNKAITYLLVALPAAPALAAVALPAASATVALPADHTAVAPPAAPEAVALLAIIVPVAAMSAAAPSAALLMTLSVVAVGVFTAASPVPRMTDE